MTDKFSEDKLKEMIAEYAHQLFKTLPPTDKLGLIDDFVGKVCQLMSAIIEPAGFQFVVFVYNTDENLHVTNGVGCPVCAADIIREIVEEGNLQHTDAINAATNGKVH